MESVYEMENITVLSLFDGISCGQIALERAGIPVKQYYASEIKKCAIKVTQENYPNTIQLGDVTKVSYKDGILNAADDKHYDAGKIDLVIFGSPCQDFSLLKPNGEGLNGSKSKLFYEAYRLLNEIKPEYFLFENVRMKKENEETLNKLIGVDGIHINSRLVSFQNRPRIYWTNIPNVTVPEDRHISFQTYKDTDYEYCKQFKLKRNERHEKMWSNGEGKNSIKGGCRNVTHEDKVMCLTRNQDSSPNSGLVEFEDFCRFLTKRELELAQTLPEGYTDCLSYNQTQDVCGDGWTVDVIAHIFSYLKKIKNF